MLFSLNNNLVLLDNKKGLKSLSKKTEEYSTFIKNILTQDRNILTQDTLSILLNKKISRTNFSLSREINNYTEYKKYDKINPLCFLTSWESLNKRQILSMDFNIQDELAYFIETEEEINGRKILVGDKVDILTIYIKYYTTRKKENLNANK